MKQLHSAQDAIGQAIEGGFWDYFELLPLESVELIPDGSTYEVRAKGDGIQVERPVNDILIDPLFWQALGKARGWKNGEFLNGKRVSPDSDFLPRGVKEDYLSDWLYHAIKWFENRMVGGDETRFWESLP